MRFKLPFVLLPCVLFAVIDFITVVSNADDIIYSTSRFMLNLTNKHKRIFHMKSSLIFIQETSNADQHFLMFSTKQPLMVSTGFD